MPVARKLIPARHQLTDRTAIIARMAEDVADLARRFGPDRSVLDTDLLRLGWNLGQIRTLSRPVSLAAAQLIRERAA